MPDAPVDISVNDLDMLALRRVHRRAGRLAIMTGLPLPVVITWWLNKLPESVTASQQVEVPAIELKTGMLKRSRQVEEESLDEVDQA